LLKRFNAKRNKLYKTNLSVKIMRKSATKKPIIGISTSLLMIDNGCFRGRERIIVGQDYVRSILFAGGTPIVLPILSDQEQIEQQIELIDGLLLSGGCDVHPHFYKEEPHPLLQDLCPERDLHEIQLVQLAHQSRKPILGICRGAQLLNVAFGGTLYQDVSLHSNQVYQHIQQAQVHVAAHEIKILEHSILKKTMEVSHTTINSFHHQSVKKVAPGFRINAVAGDGIIEGIEKEDSSFIIGVQWHPELMADKQEETRKLFEGLVKASQ
jgi:putative glutamine amidotransferase